MTGFASYAQYRQRVDTPFHRSHVTKAAIATSNAEWTSYWIAAPNGGAVPTVAAVPTNATAGALVLPASTGTLRLPRGIAAEANTSNSNSQAITCDRLAHIGGLDATVTTEQTMTLPPAGLTRYTSGVNVFIGLEIYTVIGATSTTVSVRYTNSAGTGSRATPAHTFGNTGFKTAGTFLWLPLQLGDVGVKSVEGVTVLATTGTAGNFGVTLFRPISATFFEAGLGLFQDEGLSTMNFEPALAAACLFDIVCINGVLPVMMESISFTEDP